MDGAVLGASFAAAAAVLVYANTLPAGFAFDDSFAVVRRLKGACPDQQHAKPLFSLMLADLQRGCNTRQQSFDRSPAA
jgi:hypothetical protein